MLEMKKLTNDRNGFKVLDHGVVALVSYMQPDRAHAQWSPDMEIVRNARVSYNNTRATGENSDADEKLLRYLLKNRHTSPFEAMVFTFEVKCPMFVARQWMRHRTWSYNEVSARYSKLPNEFYVPEVSSITTQASGNKQMRTNQVHLEAALYREKMREQCQAAFELYEEMLENGIARELARGVLPMNTYTHFFATVDLHNLLHFLELRDHPHAQPEIRVYARAILKIISEVCYVTMQQYNILQEEKEIGK